MANFRRVLEFDKLAVEWPLLRKMPRLNFEQNKVLLRKLILFDIDGLAIH
jgi:hypothetical protein